MGTTIHEGDDWDTGERLEFVRYHPCVSVLIDRFKAAPADLARPADGVDVGSLAEQRTRHEMSLDHSNLTA